MNPIETTDADRYPLLSEAGRRMLEFLREHPHAPIYRNQSGNRLDATDLDYVYREEASVLSENVGWPPNGKPVWLDDFVASCRRDVPHYRNYAEATHFTSLPTISRAHLGHDITAFVPDSLLLERLINFQTSGTTGHPLLIASHPRVAAGYLAYHKRALRRFGVTLTASSGEVGVVLIGHQLHCFTYISVTPSMNEAGLAKINLHSNDWRAPEDRARYLHALAPEVIAGDPLSFTELLHIAPDLRPKALLSTSMTLLPGLRDTLSSTFACPVLDLYSLNEAGPVAVFDPSLDGHVLLQPHLFVEILDAAGNPVPHGERGEITLTGGFNFCLPLLRYRTGDFASIDFVAGEPILRGLEGRALIRFRRDDGIWLNNIDVTHALRPLPLARFALHQCADATFEFSVEGPSVAKQDAMDALQLLLGPRAQIAIKIFPSNNSAKAPQYSSTLIDSDS